jgi:hypothetical protein
MGAKAYTVQRLAELAVVRARVEATLGGSFDKVIAEAEEVLKAAREAGQGQAITDLKAAGLPTGLPPQMNMALSMTAMDTIAAITGMKPLILREFVDAYQALMAGPVSMVTAGAVTRVEATQAALREWAYKGVAGFVDRGGREWSPDAYAEMAVRTGGMNAMREGYAATLKAVGEDLVRVTGHGYTCEKCAKYQGRILSLTGATPNGRQQVLHATEDRTIWIEVTASVQEATADGLFHPNCFPAETLVQTVGSVDASDTRRYKGDVIVIKTASGNELTVTPNHPILTPEGWVKAGALREGMHVVRHNAWSESPSVDRPDEVEVPTAIGDVHRSLKESGSVTTVSVPVSAHDFHGDGIVDTEVEVVLTDRLLENYLMSELSDGGGETSLFVGGVRLGLFLPEGALGEVVHGSGHSPDCVVGPLDRLSSLLGCLVPPSSPSGLALVGPISAIQQDARNGGLGVPEAFADLSLSEDAFVPEPFGFVIPSRLGPFDRSPTEAKTANLDVDPSDTSIEAGRQVFDGLSGEVSLSEIVEIDRRDFDGHVYNLQTGNRWYLADSIIVHNCEHSTALYLPGITTLDPAPENKATYEASQAQRALEVDLRKLKRELAACFTPEAQTEVRSKIRARQKQIRELIADHSMLKRKPLREQIKTAH